MKFVAFSIILSGFVLLALGQKENWNSFLEEIKLSHKFETKSFDLAKQNRLLKAELSKLRFEHTKLENKLKMAGVKPPIKEVIRKIASVDIPESEDLVQYEIYQWTPNKLLAVARKELHFRHYEKSAQFYHELLTRFSDSELIDDQIWFEGGIASYESKRHYPWASKFFSKVVADYPNSHFYRGAKLWLGLTYHSLGKKQQFLKTLNEFKTKYRNTKEWNILKKHYEDLAFNNREN